MQDNNRPKLGPLDIPGPSEYIAISVAEYHFLTKAATMLETILNAEQYNPKPTVDAVRKTVEEMTRTTTETIADMGGIVRRTVVEE